jgi:phage shock protein PspC (stress-responsive transcriptional regulator)
MEDGMDVDETRADGPEGPQGPQAPAGDEAPTQRLDDAPRRRRLVRTRDDRVLGGVCSGLGRHFDVDPILFRIGAIALTFAGGAGVLLYVAALLLIPNETGDGAAASPSTGRSGALATLGVVVLLCVSAPFLIGGGLLLAGILVPLAFVVAAGVVVWWIVAGEGPSGDGRDIARRAALGIGVLVLCAIVFIGGAWAAAIGGDAVVAGIVIAAGLAILVGAFTRPARWLILPAISLALAAGVVAASDINLDGGVGERQYRPASSADLEDRYELGMGELQLDLRDTDLPPGDTMLEIDMGIGEARLLVAEDVCVATRAEIGMGGVDVFSSENGGIDFEWLDQPQAAAGTSRLVVDAQIGLGELRVSDSALGEFDRSDWDFGPDDERGGDEPNAAHRADNAACESGGGRERG